MQKLKNYYVIGLIKFYLFHYRMLKYFVRYWMIVDTNHEIISFKQCEWSENYKSSNTEKTK